MRERRTAPGLLSSRLVLILGLATAGPAAGQLAVVLINTVPPGIIVTNAGVVTVSYSVQGTANAVQVDLFRDGAQQVTVQIPDPTNPPL